MRAVLISCPKVDLKGATPETLARALFRRVEPLRPPRVRKSVAGDEVTVEKVPTDEPGDGTALAVSLGRKR